MGVQVAVDPAAAVEEDQQRSGALGAVCGRDVEARPATAHGQVTDRADGLGAAHHRGLAQHRTTTLGDGEGLRARLPGELLHPQHQLHVRSEDLSVADDAPTGEQPLDGLRQGHRPAERQALEVVPGRPKPLT